MNRKEKLLPTSSGSLIRRGTKGSTACQDTKIITSITINTVIKPYKWASLITYNKRHFNPDSFCVFDRTFLCASKLHPQLCFKLGLSFQFILLSVFLPNALYF